MNIVNTEAYRSAFVQYLRKGTPIRLSRKDAGLTGRYVWRTRRDAKVRLSHRGNDGRIFSWADAPDTGHPGEYYNCRCEAVPYVEGQTEFAFFDLATDTGPANERWENHDFVWHFFTGAGRGGKLTEIGHLREIIARYAYKDGGEGAFRRLADQIVKAARKGDLPYSFEGSYNFEDVEFSHGDATVRGRFEGSVIEVGDMLTINGTARFRFEDRFTDPVDLREFSAWLRERPDRLWRILQSAGALVGIGGGPQGAEFRIDEDDVSSIFMAISELGGAAYPIIGEWEAGFYAEVFRDQAQSLYRTGEGLP